MLITHPGALLLSAGLLLAGSAGPARADEVLLQPGASLERELAAGQAQSFRAEAAEETQLLTVRQLGVDVEVAVRRPAGEEVRSGAPSGRWGLEVLVLPATAGEAEIEVRPRVAGGLPGRYVISLEELPPGAGGDDSRRQAMEAMSRVGQLFPLGTPEALAQVEAAGQEALALWRSRGETSLEAEVLVQLANLAYQRGDLRAASAAPGTVVLALQLEGPFEPSYRVVLRDAQGHELWRGDGLQVNEMEALSLSLPASLLAPGDYLLLAEASTQPPGRTPARFTFRVLP